MSYIGNQPATSFETVQKQISTSNSGTTITLDKAVTSVQDILLTIDAVVQSYDNYSVNGTTLTVGGTLNNNRVEILYVGRTFGSIEPSADSVGSSTLKSNAVTTAKINNDAVTVDKLNLISTGSVPSLEAKGTSGVTEGYIQLNCAENSHGIKLKSPPHSAGASYTLTFPNNDGNANQVLTTNGSGVLSFADAPSGGLVPLAQVDSGGNVGSISLDFATSTYTNYIVIVDKMIPASSGAYIYMQFRDESGALTSSNYGFSARALASNNGGEDNGDGDGQTQVKLATGGISNGSNKLGMRMVMHVQDPYTSSVYTGFHGTYGFMANTGYANSGYFGGIYHDNDSVRGVKLYLNTGGNLNGRIKAYGVVDSWYE